MKTFLLSLVVSLAFATVHYKETFDSSWGSRWIHADRSGLGKFELTAGKWYGDKEADKGIQTSQDAKFYAIASKIPTPFSNEGKPLVIQYTVKHEQNIDCGGGYLKVLPDFELKGFEGETKYYVMFGPDICGATKKIHFIFHYKGQNLLWKKEPRAETDQLTHVYTAVINPDNTYEVLVDNVKRESGKLEEDWDFLKPKTIPDPNDKKPSDWVDEAEIDDPEDKKPADWDSIPETIPDPDATQPEDWDEEEDGKWEPPTISNPKFKGKWKPKRIPNPKYKGVWKAREIPNPDYVSDDKLYKYDGIAAVGFDLWQVKSGTIFDNIIITDSVQEAKDFYESTTGKTKDAEKKNFDKVEEDKRKAEEEERKKREAEDKSKAQEDEEDDEEEEDDSASNKKDEL
eukprot:NODE_2964_length_1450_cov_134.246420_g2569_i0.p1 GENE.NODE_2964_length_1450_cov_134.246420_g2569_i0~~NODE_2964_length_1450_cov_134.246420_g2569_i0.p1  ORF type:complete len:400 (-),score=111.10 NODE_2964_length_1450_cov_134.246420_g2569_i0:192-1391(-)